MRSGYPLRRETLEFVEKDIRGNAYQRTPDRGYEFDIRTVQEEGWSSVQNELLSRASPKFDVLVTADQRLQYIPHFDIGVVVIAARDTRLASLRSLLPQLKAAITNVAPGSVIVVKQG